MQAPIACRGTAKYSWRVLLQAFFFLLTTVGGALVGSPPSRGILAGACCLAHLVRVTPAQAGMTIFVIFSIGPYPEALMYYIKYVRTGRTGCSESAADWFDMSAFYMCAIMALPPIVSIFGMGREKYQQLLMHMAPAAVCFSFPCAPSWAPDLSTQIRMFFLFMLAFVLSFAFYISLELTAEETRERERSHERYVAALSHDFGTPLTSMSMAINQMTATCSAKGTVMLHSALG